MESMGTLGVKWHINLINYYLILKAINSFSHHLWDKLFITPILLMYNGSGYIHEAIKTYEQKIVNYVNEIFKFAL